MVPDALNVLQEIVDECRLGRTILFHHTDGVASLQIENEAISAQQIECIRRNERPGLFLEEPYGDDVADSMDALDDDYIPTQAELDAISDSCGAPREWLIAESYLVRFEAAPEMDYEEAACVLNAIREAGVTRFGFIGNEKVAPEEGQ